MYYEFELDKKYKLDTRVSLITRNSVEGREKDKLFPLRVCTPMGLITIRCGEARIEFGRTGVCNFGMPKGFVSNTHTPVLDCLTTLSNMAQKIKLIQLSDDIMWFMNQIGYIERHNEGNVSVRFDTSIGHPITSLPVELVEKYDLGMKDGVMNFSNEEKMWNTLRKLNMDLFLYESKPEYTLMSTNTGRWYVKGNIDNYYRNIFRIFFEGTKWVGIYPEFTDEELAKKFLNALSSNR